MQGSYKESVSSVNEIKEDKYMKRHTIFLLWIERLKIDKIFFLN